MTTCENKGKEMREIEFNVKFITPLLIGGAYPRKADPFGLTGKALRGCWRFWFRAMVGGMVDGIKSEDLHRLESSIFGSVGDKNLEGKVTGAKFRMIIECKEQIESTSKLGFNKMCNCKGEGCEKCNYTGKSKEPAESKGYLENSLYTIKVIPRKNIMSDAEIDVLLATIWVWGNLGAIGKRLRRGFGSPVICPSSGNEMLFKFSVAKNKEFSLPIKDKFTNRQVLQLYLKEGLPKVWLIYKNWIENEKIKNLSILKNTKILNISVENTPSDDAPYFILRSYKQISVGNKSYNKIDDAITAVHGKRNCYGMGWAGKPKPNSKASKRMASPLFIRFHQVAGIKENELFPVVTWCKQKYVRDHVKDNSEYIDCIMEFLSSINMTNNLCGGAYE